MIRTTLAWDQPPWGTTTPAAPQTIITVVLGLAVAGFVIAALASWYRTKRHLYVYYGDQPFIVGGFPLSQLVFNAFGSMLGAVVVTRLSWFFTDARQLLLLLVPFVTFMSSWAVGMPLFLVLGTDAAHGLRMIAAVVSMSLGLIGIDTTIRFGTGQLRLLPPITAAPNTTERLSKADVDRSAVGA
ncbi:hypothetical protein OK015_19565 [Mycobacterium sp. Aquia_216]|uniref:hypothetical protein n=1 Tax=Mycobacterium sp. Aquia_216 TaxID=2991729 RepID=UPI00227B5AE5|nr:hypothetical protein [Mycobacterium sp. Aquia_216]WAJ43396.1 hypothetical protein OK015_19565 [Mycobacterium sp. Aquia_216]